MADDAPGSSGSKGSGSASSDVKPSTNSIDDITPANVSSSDAIASRDDLHAQAVRFLTSLRGSSSTTTDEAKRDFLRAKGLGEGEISRAFADAVRPDEKADGADSTVGHAVASTRSDEQAFELAARQFDDPLHAPPPPSATYPRSPLALYYDQQQQQGSAALLQQQKNARRYQVLLRFFRSLSALLMLGGGVTGVLVALYRAYLLPRLTDSMSARSDILKHHHSLWNELVERVRTARKASLAPHPQSPSGMSSPALRGVLKRVSFADDVGRGDDAAGDTKEAGSALSSPAVTEKAVIPSTDVVVETRIEANGEDKEGPDAQAGDTVKGRAPARPALAAIDLSGPLRSSLASLAATLRADTSASSIGQPIRPIASTSAAAGDAQTPPAPSVEDERDDAGSDGEDSLEEGGDDDDLEFDPFGLTPSSKGRSRGRGGKKHSPAPYSAYSSGGPAEHRAVSSLSDSLTSLKARIATEKYRAETGGMFSQPPRVFGAGADKDKSKAGEEEEEGENRRKGVEVAQIRAEIRNLKGLLLSRRNFPSHRLNVGTPASS